MAARIKFYVDWFNHVLRRGPATSGTISFPTLFQGAVMSLQIQIIEPDPNGNPNSFVVVDPTNLALTVSLFDTRPTGGDDSGNLLASQTSFTADTQLLAFNGDFALNTAAIDTYLGATTNKTAWIEFRVTESSNMHYAYQAAVDLFSTGIEPTTASVPAGETPLSLEVARQMFATRLMEKGDSMIFQSADETKHIRIFTHDDGSWHTDPF